MSMIILLDTALAAIDRIEDPEVPLDRALLAGEAVSDKAMLLYLAREIILKSASERLSSTYEGDHSVGQRRADQYLWLSWFVCGIYAEKNNISVEECFGGHLPKAKKEVGCLLGGGELSFEDVPMTNCDLALFRSLSVRVVYRSAREMGLVGGKKGMKLFAHLMLSLEKIAKEISAETGRPRDLAVSLWSLQGQATAMAFLDKEQQIQLNRRVVERVCDLDTSALEDPDIQFVYDLAMLGLAENDPDFLRLFGEDVWVEIVGRAYDCCYPDFPGRALALAKYLDGLGRNDEADGLIQKALSLQSYEFGKPSQIAQVHSYLSSVRQS